HADLRELVERRARAVVLHLDAVEQSRGSAARAHAHELVAHGLDALVHAGPGVVHQLVDGHVGSSPDEMSSGGRGATRRPVATTVPMLSPRTTRPMFGAASMLKT